MPSVRLMPRAAKSSTFSFSPNASGVGANAGNWWIARTPLALRLNVSVPIARVYRGRQRVVAGDQKQLPPSTFFDRMDNNDDPEEADGLCELP